MNEQVKNETIPSAACAVVLLIAASTQWPYFMYVLLRVFICGSSAYIASRLYARHSVRLTWLFGAVALLFNPIIPVRMARSDWEVINVLAAVIFIAFLVHLNWDKLSRRQSRKIKHTRLVVRAVAAICTRMKGHDIRILELTPTDSALADFSVVTSAISHLQATAIADEVELRLKNDWGLIPISDNRNVGWILLDYADFTVHIFLAEQRAFYDIEGSRKSAKSFIPAEFNSPMKH
jgi:ribosome silencing factor RsfS/YbeB/iojap